jgi:hypothetical protein
MSNVIPFDKAPLPAFLQGNAVKANDDLTANVGAGFPYMSIKGKNFTLIRGDDRRMLTRVVDGETFPAPSISVVLVKANKNFSKVWYAKQFVEGSDAKPDCFSNNGDVPDPSAEKPQAKACATCPKNQWGSRISDNGNKGKECQDARRVAIAVPGLLNDPMLLRVPPATLKPLAEYGTMLAKRGVPYSAVITKISFDSEAATPKLVFEPNGFLTEEQFAEVQELLESPIVDDIIGATGFGAPLPAEELAEKPAVAKASKTVQVAEEVVTEAQVVQQEPVPEVDPLLAAMGGTPIEAELVTQPAATAKKETKAKTKPTADEAAVQEVAKTTTVSAGAELDDLLKALDD